MAEAGVPPKPFMEFIFLVIGVCAPADEELIQESFSNSTKTCSQSKFHICTAQANYGLLSVDWESRSLTMGVRTPEEDEGMYHTIHF